MFYDSFIKEFIHPFIIYVVVGTLMSYLLAWLLVRFNLLKESRTRAVIYTAVFIVPVVAFLLRKPLKLDRCFVYGHQLGTITDWLCFAGNFIAVFLTPLFLASVLFAIIRISMSMVASYRFISTCGYASSGQYPDLFFAIEMLCQKARLKIPRVIVTKDSFARAFTTGYRSPTIVLSEGLLEGLDSEELETVIAHELGHIARGDSLLNRIVIFLRDLMFFNPLAFLVFRDFMFEKEKAADDFAIKLTQKPMPFAQALIKVWRMTPKTLFDSVVTNPGFVSYEGILEKRVRRIIDDEHKSSETSFMVLAAIGFLTLATGVILYFVC